ncbi:hypothetical protein [Siccibacter turicensis]|uniref:hypothetical protein n=1 Tax=Siccibacter turicensis TaxID=357233 RepID=UPI002A6A69DE|nr:hypothetical protein [Siccibacter turicensis]MDY0972612.1 hypothetical protein [Siccibacter turicensis]
MTKFTKDQLIARLECHKETAKSIAPTVRHLPVAFEMALIDIHLSEITLAALKAPQFPQSVPEHIANVFIAAIEKEQERLHGEDYLMDSRDCIDVIREEIQRLNASQTATHPRVQGDGHATD